MDAGYREYVDSVVRSKYTLDGETSFSDVVIRVSRAIAEHLETLPKRREDLFWKYLAENSLTEKPIDNYNELRKTFEFLLSEGIFLPGGRVLFGAGNNDRVTLTNCYVLPSPEDSMEGIMETIKEAALTYRAGGGVGFDLSSLRPEGSPVRNAARKSTGAWSFMELFSTLTKTIGQEGRRGALLLAMSIEHPDVLKFASAKAVLSPTNRRLLEQYKIFDWTPEQLEAMEKILTFSQVTSANISVKITDEFMRAVEKDEVWKFRFNGTVYSEMPARKIFREIAELAWRTAEPGLLFPDTARKYSVTEYFAPIVNTNPCGEQWLEAYGNCNLGSVNVGHPFLFTNGQLDEEKLKKVIKLAVLFLHDVIFYNLERHPLQQQKEAANRTRRVGLGIMGLADCYIRHKVKYGDRSLTEKLGFLFFYNAYEASTELASIFEPFPDFDKEKHLESAYFRRIYEIESEKGNREQVERLFEKIRENGLANGALLTAAPTGSISILARCSSGIEPVFFFEIERWLESKGSRFQFLHPVFEEYLEKGGDKKNLPPYFETFKDVDYQRRVETQKILQTYIDNSISSTVNLPEKTTIEEVEQIFATAYRDGLKGITVYREGSRAPVVKKAEKKEQKQKAMISIPAEKKEYLEGKRYRFKFDGETIYLMVFGEDNVPREVFLGSKNMKCWEFAIALNNTLSEILRSLPPDLARKFAERISEKYKSLKSDRTAIVYNEKVDSIIGLWALALDWYMNNINPSDIPKVIVKAGTTKEPPEKLAANVINLYGKDIDLTALPKDALTTKCPSCGVIIISKNRPYPLNCDNPCPSCGFTGTCS